MKNKFQVIKGTANAVPSLSQLGPISDRTEIIKCNHCGNIGDKGPFQAEVYTKVILKVSPVENKGKPVPGKYDVTNMTYPLTEDTHEVITKCLVCGSTKIETTKL